MNESIAATTAINTPTTPLKRWLNGEITSGKFAELLGVPRHVGDELLFDAFQLREDLKSALDHGSTRERIALDELAAAKKNSWSDMVCPNHHDAERAAHIGLCPLCAFKNLAAMQEMRDDAHHEIEKLKEDRNRSGLVERKKYLPEILRLRNALVEIKEHTHPPFVDPKWLAHAHDVAIDALNKPTQASDEAILSATDTVRLDWLLNSGHVSFEQTDGTLFASTRAQIDLQKSGGVA